MSVLIKDMEKPKFCYEIIDGKYEYCPFVNTDDDCVLLLKKGICERTWQGQYSKCPLIEAPEPCEDTISRKMVMDAIKESTPHCVVPDDHHISVVDMEFRISKLPSVTPRPESCEDAVSRKELLKLFSNNTEGSWTYDTVAIGYIKALPSVMPERHTCDTCKHYPPSKKWPCVDCDMREPADRWESQDVPDTNDGKIADGDLISRQAAIDALHMDTSIIPFKKAREYADATISEIRNRLEKLPSAQHEPCEDAVSRQAAIGTIKHMKDVCDTYDINDYYNLLIEAFSVMPSVQPEPCLDSIVSEIKKTISETKESGKYHCDNIRINGEMICFGLQLALEIIEEKRNGQSDKQTGGD